MSCNGQVSKNVPAKTNKLVNAHPFRPFDNRLSSVSKLKVVIYTLLQNTLETKGRGEH